jgi:hypothetical protein
MLGVTAAAPVFHINFYTTAATVIPVLLLALTVQERSLLGPVERVLRTIVEAQRDRMRVTSEAMQESQTFEELIDAWMSTESRRVSGRLNRFQNGQRF